MDACRHLKAIAVAGVPGLMQKTGVSDQPGVLKVTGGKEISDFIRLARNGKVWEGEEM
jgi:hypothetical protein